MVLIKCNFRNLRIYKKLYRVSQIFTSSHLAGEVISKCNSQPQQRLINQASLLIYYIKILFSLTSENARIKPACI